MMNRIGAYHRMITDEEGYGKQVEFFGYGTFLGEEVPPPGIMFLGRDISQYEEEYPKLQLDNGDIIWGFECVFATEEQMKRDISGLELINVSIHDVRGKI
jgi:hypothetical protein